MEKVYALLMCNEETDYNEELISIYETEEDANNEKYDRLENWELVGFSYEESELIVREYPILKEKFIEADNLDILKFENIDEFKKYVLLEFKNNIDHDIDHEDIYNQVKYFGVFMDKLDSVYTDKDCQILARFFYGLDFLDCDLLELNETLSSRTIKRFYAGERLKQN